MCQQENRIVGQLLELSHDRHTKCGFLVTNMTVELGNRCREGEMNLYLTPVKHKWWVTVGEDQ